MKFICPSCKAKYQIADEKAAGRALRMKCRKCGHMIHIRAGASEPPPGPGSEAPANIAEAKAPPAKPATPARSKLEPSPPAPKAEATRPVPKAAASPSAPKAEATPRPAKAFATPAARPVQPTAAAPRTGPARAAAPAAAPRPTVSSAAMPPRPLSPASAPSTRTAAPSAIARPGPQATQPTKPVAKAPLKPPTRSTPPPQPVVQTAAAPAVVAQAPAPTTPATSSLAGAFSAAVIAPPTERPADVGGDWYIGINGSPVGPIPLSYLRAKAAMGAVTLESLVWRDGFEQWQALKNFPELAAIIEESVSGARASVAPVAMPSAAPPAAVASAPLPAPVAAPPAVQPAEPFAVAAAAPTTGPAVVADKLDLEIAGLPTRRGTSPAAWIAVIVALLFGLTIGFVVFSSKAPAEPIIKYVERPAKPTVTVAAAPAPEQTAAPVSPEESVQASKSGTRVAGQKATGPTPEQEQKPLEGLKGLAGLQGAAPRTGPVGTETAAARSGEPLDSGAVQRTVSRYTSSVKRSCWQPALDTRDKDAPTTARVSVAITVSPSGSVQEVTTSGDPRGYRGLASCIGSRVRGWQFPASNGATTVNVPFVFAAQ